LKSSQIERIRFPFDRNVYLIDSSGELLQLVFSPLSGRDGQVCAGRCPGAGELQEFCCRSKRNGIGKELECENFTSTRLNIFKASRRRQGCWK
jgi:hypothetical protein